MMSYVVDLIYKLSNQKCGFLHGWYREQGFLTVPGGIKVARRFYFLPGRKLIPKEEIFERSSSIYYEHSQDEKLE